MSKTIEIGPYSAYAIAVKYGYTGSEEQWIKEQETNRIASEQARDNANDAAERAETALQQMEAAKTDALKALDTKQTSATTAVESAHGKALDAVTDAQDTATQAVQAEQASAITAVKKAGAEVLTSIPEDYQNTVQKVKELDAQKVETDEAISAVKARQNVLVGSETGNPLSVDDAFPAPLCGLTVYGKSTQDGTPTLDVPVPIVSAGESGSVAVKVTGKNLLHLPDGSKTLRGITITAKDGSISISGTATETGYAVLDIPPFITPGVLTLSSSIEQPVAALTSQTWAAILFQNTATKMSDAATRLVFTVEQGQTYDLTGVKLQLELGTTATAYSPYREQLLTLPTPNGLPGIPVTSGGSYTDSTGQQWVCDEVDLTRGVRVQRVNAVDLSTCKITGATELAVTKRLSIMLPICGRDYKTEALCNKLQFVVSFSDDTPHFYVDTTNVQVFIPIGAKNPEEGEYILFYALATPIEKPLTSDELDAYKAIVAYGPDTVVQASDGVGIKLDYQRDVNLVVKNLEDAIASMTTT